MSSILKALQKAEKEGSVYQTNPGLTLNIQRLIERASSKPGSSRFPFKMFMSIILLLVIFSGAGIYLYLPDSHTPSKTETTRSVHKAKAVADQPGPTEPGRLPDRPPHQKNGPAGLSAVVAGPPDRMQEPPPEARQPDTKRPVPGQPDISRKKTPPLTTPKQPPAPKQPAAPQATVKAKAPPEKAKPVLKQPEVTPKAAKAPPSLPKPETMGSDTLRIQAISWSPTESQRIVVLNNRVVSEGETVEGYKIIEIKRDGVILEKDGTAKRLVLKHQ